MNRHFVSILVGVAACVSAQVARAQGSSPGFALHWDAPDECPDDVQLVHRIENLLGQSLPGVDGQALRVHASVQGNAEAGYVGKLSFAGAQANEQRFLEHPSCEKLVEALALVIALAIDPERVRAVRQARDAASGTTDPSPIAAPAPAVVADCPAEPATAPVCTPETAGAQTEPGGARSLHGLRVALHGLIGAGLLPDLGAGVEGALGFQPGRFRLELVGRYWAPREQTLAEAPETSLQVELVTLGGRGCWLLPANAWRLSVCGGPDFGSYRGQGIGVENSRPTSAFVAQLSGGLQIAYTRWPLVPEGGLEVSGVVARPRFGVQRDGRPSDVFQPTSWAFAAFFGFAFEP